jgi:hypothetical protein
METETVSETFNTYTILKQLIVQEDVAYSFRESSKSHTEILLKDGKITGFEANAEETDCNVYVHVLSRERRTGKGNEYIP